MNNQQPVTFSEVIGIIENASDFEINEVMNAVMRRYQKFYPEWEVIYIACPKNGPVERQRTMESIIDYFQRHT